MLTLIKDTYGHFHTIQYFVYFLTFVWFACATYVRFTHTGRVCSGDFEVLPLQSENPFISEEGDFWKKFTITLCSITVMYFLCGFLALIYLLIIG